MQRDTEGYRARGWRDTEQEDGGESHSLALWMILEVFKKILWASISLYINFNSFGDGPCWRG